MHGFKSAILAIFQFCQNGTFEPVHETQKKILSKSILLKHYENGNKKKCTNQKFDVHGKLNIYF